jgi:hypothetical protein
MTVGLPVVGLATTELPTIIEHGVNGFADTDPGRLVEAMRALLADPGLARAIGDAGRATAQERFSIDRFVRDWDRLLRDLCGPVGAMAPAATPGAAGAVRDQGATLRPTSSSHRRADGVRAPHGL